MSRYRFEIATPADDAQLRHVLAECPMEGRISVSLLREPSYFRAAVVEGPFRQVVSVHDSEDGRIVGFGSRSVRERYINGQPAPVGYLSTLRLLDGHRNRGLLARGYAFLRQLHSDGRTPFYLTTIAAGNETALQALTTRRAGLPAYHGVGDFYTLAIPIPRRARRVDRGDNSNLHVRPAQAEDLPHVISFLNEYGPQRQFFPCYGEEDFFTSDGTFRDLKPDDLLLAFRQEQLAGILGAWDQHGFRQSVVHHYGQPLQWMRPLYNGWARLRGVPQLPKPGQAIQYRMGALPIVAGDDEAVFTELLNCLLRRLACEDATATGQSGVDGSPADFLLLGLHACDPLLPIARRKSSACYTTHVFVVCWDDGEQQRARLDARLPYLELGML